MGHRSHARWPPYNQRLSAQAALWAACALHNRQESTVFISTAYAQTAPAAAAEGGLQSSLMSMLPIVLMFVVLYFIMIRPQMKKQKEHRSMVEALAKGDEVVTVGGMLGRVSSVGDNQLGLEIASGVEVQIQRHAVAQVLPKGTLK
jgi:preprotein translocase subunit YajC